jgi:hypothetical protein
MFFFRVKFQSQDYVIIVTNFQQSKTLYKICWTCTFETTSDFQRYIQAGQQLSIYS